MTPQTTNLSMSALAMSAALLCAGQVHAAPAAAPISQVSACAKGYTCIDFTSKKIGYEAFEGLISAGQDKDPVKKNKPNKVAKFVKGPTGQPWAGATIYTNVADKSVKPLGLDKSLIVTVRAYSEAAGQTMRLKVEAANDPTVTIETDALSTVAGKWETLTFDLSKPAPGTPAWNPAKTYNKVSLFPQFSISSPPAQDTTTYFDDVTYRTGKAGGGGGSLIFASNYGDTGTGWLSVEGGTAGNYIDDSVATQLWWRGVAPNDATPSFYFGYGINVNAKPWGFGAFVNAPGNGTAKVSGYTGVKIAVWGNDELMNSHPTLTLLLVGPAINGCAAAVQGLMPVTAPGVQTYTVAYTGMTLATPCAFATVKDALAAGVAAVNVQVLGANVQYKAGGDGQGNFPNGLNVGPISFN
jgi:hypothetical protein